MEPAGPGRVERRLAAILAADVAGYSRLIEADEEGTLARLKALRAEVIDPKIDGHHGRIVKTTGDGLLVEFASVVDALRCAAEAQAAMAESNDPLPPDRRIEFRIGINMGDIVVEDGDIFGDGVNVAARLEGLVRKDGNRVRITAQLIDAASGAHLWADRFDGSLDEVFELQDEVAVRVAGVIEPTLQADEVRCSSERAPQDQTAYDLDLRALVNFPWTSKEQLSEARDLCDRSLARDPRYPPALGWAAICHARFFYDGWAENPALCRRTALALVERALAVGNGNRVC